MKSKESYRQRIIHQYLYQQNVVIFMNMVIGMFYRQLLIC